MCLLKKGMIHIFDVNNVNKSQAADFDCFTIVKLFDCILHGPIALDCEEPDCSSSSSRSRSSSS